jgi:hypothetical protein
MRKMMTKDSKTHIEKEKLEKQVKDLLQKLSDDNRKKELEKEKMNLKSMTLNSHKVNEI